MATIQYATCLCRRFLMSAALWLMVLAGGCTAFDPHLLDSSIDGVSAAGCQHCMLPFAKSRCDNNRCAVEHCFAGHADCDGDPANGCEADLRSLEHCAICGRQCAAPNSVMACNGNQCEFLACQPGFMDCDQQPGNGCETPINTPLDCGACRRVCSYPNGLASCAAGQCGIGGCQPGFGDCDLNPANGCETPLTTLSDCGACGNRCVSLPSAAASCTGGRCTTAVCPPGLADCDGDGKICETNLQTSLAHCGACGAVCAVPATVMVCQSGLCKVRQCPANFGDCDGSPFNGCEAPLNSTQHCGGCGLRCEHAKARSKCPNGVCTMGSCLNGWGDCDGDPNNGCETAMNKPLHCGACNKQCVRCTMTGRCEGHCPNSTCGSTHTGLLTFQITSDCDRGEIRIRFFDQGGPDVWPSKTEVWRVRMGASKTFSMGCTPGHTICYGAEDSGGSWGVKLDASRAPTRPDLQCKVCGQGMGNTTLVC